jgi:acetolactate synthase-1/2/3 large subunit
MTMGFALPAAIGAKVAHPGKQVVAFCGDGGFVLSSTELATAMKYNLNIVVVIINDNGYGTIKNVQKKHFGEVLGVDLFNPNFIKFAEAFNAYGFRVEKPHEFKHTLEKALMLDKPVIIEVLPGRTIKGKIYYTMKTLGKN